MDKSKNKPGYDPLSWNELSKEDTEQLVLLYLQDYYSSLDDYYLKEAFQIAKDEGIDIYKIMRIAREKLN
jgi:hypothetical protein